MRQLETCSLEERATALDRALHSHTFARSEQLKAFLRFICEAEVLRPGSPLTEYVIGVEVLRRGEGYSPAEDSSVRTRAYELRQKLDQLYSKELPDESIQISVLKGTYSPQFVRRSVTRITEEIAASRGKTQPKRVTLAELLRSKPAISVFVLVAVAMVLCGSTATWFAVKVSGKEKGSTVDPVLAAAWGPLAARDGTVVICLATLLSLVAGPYGHGVYQSRSYPAPEEAYSLFKQHRLLPADGRLGLTFTDNTIAIEQ